MCELKKIEEIIKLCKITRCHPHRPHEGYFTYDVSKLAKQLHRQCLEARIEELEKTKGIVIGKNEMNILYERIAQLLAELKEGEDEGDKV